MRIISWNVNGLKACKFKGFETFVKRTDADIVCCQEVRSKVSLNLPGYAEYWNLCSVKSGYSGTLVLTKEPPLNVELCIGNDLLDKEGRFICMEFTDFFLINVYVPNAESGLKRLDIRKEWDLALADFVSKLSKPVVMCGDFNVALEPIDIYPENLRNNSQIYGFDTDTRAGMKQMMKSADLIDAFRAYNPTQERSYTWWSNRLHKRWENRGWRLDYFLVSREIIGEVSSVEHLTSIYGSDHCPIAIAIRFWHPKINMQLTESGAYEMWSAIDWDTMERRLYRMQHKLAEAVQLKDEASVKLWSEKITDSMPAKLLAVRKVISNNSGAGIDHVKWSTNEEKMKAALSLSPIDYHHRPYHCFKIYEENGKERIIRVATQYDKAMDVLYSFALKPIAETTGDKYSFGSREGRSPYDAFACVCDLYGGTDAPEWGVYGDVEKCYDKISHDWLLNNIPMDKSVLSEFLKAGLLDAGIMYDITEGITQGSSISPILGNMTLDGLQQYISEKVFMTKSTSGRKNGILVRFIDDIIITANSEEEALAIRNAVNAFLAERGLRLSQSKTKIFNIRKGFDFLSYHFVKEDERIKTSPSEKSIKDLETRLENYILRYKGAIGPFIQGLNRKLNGWASYQRVTEAYDAFRHIDVVVQALLLRKMKALHPKRNLPSIQALYWQKIGGRFVFSDPNKRTLQVISLAEMAPTFEVKPPADVNPYIDKAYSDYVASRRDISKVSGDKLKQVWRRQNGLCYSCGGKMLSDQELSVVQIMPGQGTKASNLAYVHKRCANSAFNLSFMLNLNGNGIDTIGMLKDIAEDHTLQDDPYYALREFFRLCDRSPITLTFEKIEEIIGDKLDWQAYFSDAFWYDESNGFDRSLWERDFPTHAIKVPESRFCIAEAWSSQGYIIQRLKRDDKKVVFRKSKHNVSGLVIPAVLLNSKIPNNAKYEIEEFCAAIIKKYGLSD